MAGRSASFAGAAMPMWLLIALFIIGWIFQGIGHAVYEKRQPAFAQNLIHLLIGPLWILNDMLHVVAAGDKRQPA